MEQTQSLYLGALKGAPLSILIALLQSPGCLGSGQLVTLCGYSDKTVATGLRTLAQRGLVERRSRYNGWALSAQARQLLSFLHAGADASPEPEKNSLPHGSGHYADAAPDNGEQPGPEAQARHDGRSLFRQARRPLSCLQAGADASREPEKIYLSPVVVVVVVVQILIQTMINHRYHYQEPGRKKCGSRSPGQRSRPGWSGPAASLDAAGSSGSLPGTPVGRTPQSRLNTDPTPAAGADSSPGGLQRARCPTNVRATIGKGAASEGTVATDGTNPTKGREGAGRCGPARAREVQSGASNGDRVAWK